MRSTAGEGAEGGISTFEPLVSISRALLMEMTDPPTGLFSHKTLRQGSGYRNVGTDALYTAMSIVGALTDEELRQRVATPDRLDLVWSKARVSNDASLVGAAAWALADSSDERAVELLARACGLPVARASTMGLGLLLAGAAAIGQRFALHCDSARLAARTWRDALNARFSSTGCVFQGSAPSLTRGYLLYQQMTSFASQVYPLHGLARAAMVLELELPEACRRVAEHLVQMQGPLGQWWWFYSTRTRGVLEGYPVYSVHQDAMAYMALVPLQELGVGDYSEPLARGLRWVFGANELGRTLADHDQPFIARCVQRQGADPDAMGGISRSNRLRLVLASHRLAPAPGVIAAPDRLELLDECRPYHLGWLLYARSLARRAGL